jgi:hypothetical protein
VSTPNDDDPITLAEACKQVFRDRIKVSTLRREAERGNLVTYRVGRRDFTTLRMSARCSSDAASPIHTTALPRSEAPTVDCPRRTRIHPHRLR